MPDLNQREDRTGTHLLWAALSLIALLFAECLRFGFVYDDRSQVLANPVLPHWQGLAKYFGGTVWAYNPAVISNYFRPLYSIWTTALFHLFGTHAGGWHLNNVLLHMAVTAMLFAVAAKISQDRVSAGIGAVLFAIHPAHCETVCWITGGIPDLLVAVLVLAAYLGFLQWNPQLPRSYGWLALSLCCYAAALFSKEIAFLFPAVILAHGVFFMPSSTLLRRWGKAFALAIPYLLTASLYLLVRKHALGGLAVTAVNIPPQAEFFTAPLLALFYLRIFFFPVRLGPFYPMPYVLTDGVKLFWLPLLGLLCMAALFIFLSRLQSGSEASDERSWRENRAIRLWACWAVIFLAPAFHIARLLPNDFAHDRYLYVASAGLCMISAIIIRKCGKGRRLVFGLSPISAAGLCLVVVALAWITNKQNTYWTNDLTLFSRGANLDPSNLDALNNAAASLCERHIYDSCIALEQAIIAGHPRSWIAYLNLARAFRETGNQTEAENILSKAARGGALGPEQLAMLAGMQLDLGRFDHAQDTLNTLSATAPDTPNVHLLLGRLREGQGNLTEALREYEEQEKREPSPQVEHQIKQLRQLQVKQK